MYHLIKKFENEYKELLIIKETSRDNRIIYGTTEYYFIYPSDWGKRIGDEKQYFKHRVLSSDVSLKKLIDHGMLEVL